MLSMSANVLRKFQILLVIVIGSLTPVYWINSRTLRSDIIALHFLFFFLLNQFYVNKRFHKLLESVVYVYPHFLDN